MKFALVTLAFLIIVAACGKETSPTRTQSAYAPQVKEFSVHPSKPMPVKDCAEEPVCIRNADCSGYPGTSCSAADSVGNRCCR